MLVVYIFAAVFMAQILALSVVFPAWLVRNACAMMRKYPAERFPLLYPQGTAGVERRNSRYRLLNAVIAALGLAVLAWIYRYMQRPDWDDGPVEALVSAYFFLQMLPLAFWGIAAYRFNRLARATLSEDRRTATLKRRGLFDFVSPVTVWLAVLCYFLYVAYVLYIERHPFPGFAGYAVNIGMVTVLYVLLALSIYWTLYGRKSNPLESHADRMQVMGFNVKIFVYTSIAVVVSLAANYTLVLLDLQRWEPVVQSLFLVAGALAYALGLKALPRRIDAGDPGSSAVCPGAEGAAPPHRCGRSGVQRHFLILRQIA